MCKFISWIEKGKSVLYLTYDMIYNTDKGKMLQKWSGNKKNYIGHGAIRYYFGLEHDEGKDKECTDFSSPDNFPDAIVKAIKNGEFIYLGLPIGILTQQAWAKYEKIGQQAWAEYKKIGQRAWAEYEKIEQQALAGYDKIGQRAWAEYEKIEQQAWAEYEKIEQQALAEYEKIGQQAWAEYEKIGQQAWAEYEKIGQQALAEYEKIKQQAFWVLLKNPDNRIEVWR